MEPKIIFEDDSLLILLKPAGWITNEAGTTGSTPVVQTWLKNNFKYPISNIQYLRSGVVHRLDKETSGVLVVAKTEGAFKSLQSQFKERKVKKSYLALLHGRVEPQGGSIEAPVGRLPWRRDRFGVLPGGREATSKYEVTAFYKDKNSNYSLVEFFPETGRTHQIRIHAKHIQHPIVSDEFYAGRKTARDDRAWCPRLFLHAKSITFAHPFDNKIVSFDCEIPKELKAALSHLEINPVNS